MEDHVFSTQAATLYTTYYLVQILIYRRFIRRPSGLGSKPSAHSSFPFPAAEICVKAAESCARILEAQIKRGLGFTPNCVSVAHICAAILLADIWNLKCKDRAQAAQFEDVKPQSIQIIDARLQDISIFIKALKSVESTWDIAHTYLYARWRFML